MGVYANKFSLQRGDTVRVVFIDERAPVAKDISASSETVTEVVMTIDNARALHETLGKILP